MKPFLLVLATMFLALGWCAAQPAPDLSESEMPLPAVTPKAVGGVGIWSTGHLILEVAGARDLKYDRGTRTAWATTEGRKLILFTERHPGTLWVIISGNGLERTPTWVRPSGQAVIWQAVTFGAAPNARGLQSQLTIELSPVDFSTAFTVRILAPSDIAAMGGPGLALTGK